jgi:hypothetical protein
MSLTSKTILKKLQSKLLTQSLATQSIMDLLIEKKVFTKEEILNKIDFNMELWEDLVKENKKLLKMTNEVLERIPDEEDEVTEGLYYGPIGEC